MAAQKNREEVLDTAAAILEKRRELQRVQEELADLEKSLDQALVDATSAAGSAPVQESAAPKRGKGQVYSAFLKIVRKTKGPFKRDAVTSQMEVSDKYASTMLARAVERGDVRRVGRGQYRRA